ncbi:MAG: hypothetical protein IMF02_11155, partial [Proteobacteria bacterium]|nr:hypothetical protein [Pseudomonadota bacterium]
MPDQVRHDKQKVYAFLKYEKVCKGDIRQMVKIIIEVENLSVEAELLDTPTAQKIKDALPLKGSVNVWGDEIYFNIPLTLDQEPDASQDVEVGDLGYWPAGP